MVLKEWKKVNGKWEVMESGEEIEKGLVIGREWIGICGGSWSGKWVMEEIWKGIK